MKNILHHPGQHHLFENSNGFLGAVHKLCHYFRGGGGCEMMMVDDDREKGVVGERGLI